MTKIIEGNNYVDDRGKIYFNNDFDLSPIKRVYLIENKELSFIRAWQGHKIERRWFTAVSGSFVVKVVRIDNWQNPNPNTEIKEYLLDSVKLDVLHVDNGSLTSIQATEIKSKLLVMSDYLLGEIQDEYRFPSDYFTN